jgi:hypothetical protein
LGLVSTVKQIAAPADGKENGTVLDGVRIGISLHIIWALLLLLPVLQRLQPCSNKNATAAL